MVRQQEREAARRGVEWCAKFPRDFPRALTTRLVVSPMARKQEKKEPKRKDPVKKIFTFNLHRALQGFRSKQRAARAIREIKAFAMKEMGVSKVAILPSLNVKLWEKGIRHVPHRIRLSVARKRAADDEKEGADAMMAEVDFVQVQGENGFKGLKTEVVV